MYIPRASGAVCFGILLLIGWSAPTAETKAPKKDLPPPSVFPPIRFSLLTSYPTGETDSGIGISLPRVSANALIRDADGVGDEPAELRTWSVRIRPAETLSFYAGSISTSGLPSRAKNPVAPLSSPSLKQTVAPRYPLLRPGTTLDTRVLGLEAGNARTRMAAVAHPSDRFAAPCWISAVGHLPPVGPDATRVSIALFSGLRRLSASSGDTWFVPDPSLPETWLFLPAAELLLDGRRLQASCAAFGSFGPLLEGAGTLRTDARLRLSRLAVGARWIRSDLGFRDFSGSEDRIREQIALAPEFHVPLARSSPLALRGSVLVAREILSGDSCNEPNRSRAYFGGEIAVEHPMYSVQLGAERDDAGDTYTAEASLSQFPSKTARFHARLSATAPSSGNEARSITSVSADLTVTARPVPSLRAQGSAGFTNSLDTGRVDPRWKLALSATPGSPRKATVSISCSAGRDTGRSPPSGSLGIRVNLK